MKKLGARLTKSQWNLALDALGHAEADADAWESTKDPSAIRLRVGCNILLQMIDDRRPVGCPEMFRESEGGE
jgi:hypothetical protein